LRGESETVYPFVDEVANQVSRFSKFRLDSYNLGGASKVPEVLSPESASPRLGYYGDDLSAALYYMQEREHPNLAKIIQRVKDIVPEFGGFSFTFLGSDRIALSIQFDDKRGTVPAVRISDGLLVFIGLMVLIYSPDRPPVLMIEEPENGLTPIAIKHFYQAIKELSDATDALNRRQVLISSHSPFVICEAWNGLDRNFIHRVEVVHGSAVVKRFSEVVKDHKIVLKKDGDLSLRNAEDIMCGRYLGEAT
jgi:predicted ATPase